jgi:hypothetical protein
MFSKFSPCCPVAIGCVSKKIAKFDFIHLGGFYPIHHPFICPGWQRSTTAAHRARLRTATAVGPAFAPSSPVDPLRCETGKSAAGANPRLSRGGP